MSATEAEAPRTAPPKRPFDIHEVFARLRKAVRPLPKAAMFDLAEQGYDSAFEQLAACLISIRTRDEVTVPISLRLFAVARTPAQVAALAPPEIDKLIRGCAFHEAKACQIHEIAARCVEEHGGKLPCSEPVLLSLRGVGPKCAHLVLGIACGQSHIGVDIHVHRVTNRWGYVEAASPEGTMLRLQEELPREYWVEINRLLVPFGKHVCTGILPRCSTCPILEYCRQVGVTRHR
jgi:endonuclease III